MGGLNTFTRHKCMMSAASLIQGTFGHYSRASVGFFLLGTLASCSCSIKLKSEALLPSNFHLEVNAYNLGGHGASSCELQTWRECDILDSSCSLEVDVCMTLVVVMSLWEKHPVVVEAGQVIT